MAKSILEYWPSYYRDIKDFTKLASTEDAELQIAQGAINRLLNDQFVQTSGIDAVQRREKILGILADPATESLEFRRKRVINRYSTKPPFTIRYLQNQLDRLVGEGKAVVQVNTLTSVLTIKTALEDAAFFREFEHTIRTVKPANLVYEQTTDVFEGIEFQESMTKTSLVRQTKLSTTWKLGITRFALTEEEVTVI